VIVGEGFSDRYLSNDEVRSLVHEALRSLDVDRKRVLVIIPDGTRTMPMHMMFTLVQEALAHRVRSLDWLVALGTHQPMSNAQLSSLIGQTVTQGRVGDSRIFNHEWTHPSNLALIGTIQADEIDQITSGLMSQDVPVRLNKLIFDYDQLVICGPVFPHEVVGFSGGNKYLFPGIAGPEIINFTHWLGAVMTSYRVIGTRNTPMRGVIDRAAELVDRPVACMALVVTPAGLAGLYFGDAREAWEAAARLSAHKHIVYLAHRFRRVLSVVPEMYEDLWTGGKGMYKVEPVVADGGEVVIYAPHIVEVSKTHGKLIAEIGYHCRDYFLKQWDKFNHYPGAVLAHSTHVKGSGEYDPATGRETTRIQVTLATGIPAEECRRINLGYLRPSEVNPLDWQGREDDGVLLVPHAGEMLYRVGNQEAGRTTFKNSQVD
jgi:nickel-dependent lactate racemase